MTVRVRWDLGVPNTNWPRTSVAASETVILRRRGSTLAARRAASSPQRRPTQARMSMTRPALGWCCSAAVDRYPAPSGTRDNPRSTQRGRSAARRSNVVPFTSMRASSPFLMVIIFQRESGHQLSGRHRRRMDGLVVGLGAARMGHRCDSIHGLVVRMSRPQTLARRSSNGRSPGSRPQLVRKSRATRRRSGIVCAHPPETGPSFKTTRRHCVEDLPSEWTRRVCSVCPIAWDASGQTLERGAET